MRAQKKPNKSWLDEILSGAQVENLLKTPISELLEMVELDDFPRPFASCGTHHYWRKIDVWQWIDLHPEIYEMWNREIAEEP